MQNAIIPVVAFSILILANGLQAGQITSSGVTPNAQIPDGAPGGWTGQIEFSGLSGTVSDFQVNIDTLGGYNGDLYMTLTAPEGGKSILLNRPGITGNNPFGYSDSGFKLVLDSGSANNVHYYGVSYSLNGSGQVVGVWGADGRDISPDAEPDNFEHAPVTAGIDQYVGKDAASLNGLWTIHVADYAVGGGETSVKTVTVQVTSIPEPTTGVLLLLGSLGLSALLRKKGSQASR